MIEGLSETIKLVGGLAGLASAGFLIYDRLARFRPILTIHRESYGVNGQAYLRINNPADDTLLVTSIDCRPNIISIAIDNELRGIIGAVVEEKLENIIVAPLSEARFPIVKLKEATSRLEEKIKITVAWRRTRQVWPSERHSSLTTTISFIEKLEAGRPNATN